MKNRVKELRTLKKMTQEELADVIGVSRQTINAIEKEKFDPSLPTAFKMAELFSLKIEEIFLFNKNKDTLIVNKDSEIYSIDKKHTFKYTKEKNEKTEVEYNLIKSKIIPSFSEFIKLNKRKKYPEYFNEYSFYVFIKEKDNTGCLVEVEKIWLVEDKIIN